MNFPNTLSIRKFFVFHRQLCFHLITSSRKIKNLEIVKIIVHLLTFPDLLSIILFVTFYHDNYLPGSHLSDLEKLGIKIGWNHTEFDWQSSQKDWSSKWLYHSSAKLLQTLLTYKIPTRSENCIHPIMPLSDIEKLEIRNERDHTPLIRIWLSNITKGVYFNKISWTPFNL